MKLAILFFSSLLISSICFAESTAAGIDLDQPWKNTIYQFAKENLQHSAWGVSHSERNYLLAKKIAKSENIEVDEDVLFAAAFLHDIGVFKPYIIEGAEHSKTATDNVVEILKSTGFPMGKVDELNASISSHMFYAQVSEYNTARILHDADTLDFLGIIGAVRIISVTSRHRWATNLATAVTTIEKFNKELPEKLIYKSSKEIAVKRVSEATTFISSLKSESKEGLAL